MRAYITENYRRLRDFFARELPHLPVMNMEGTYLAWVDYSSLGESSEHIEERLMRENRVWVNAGSMYGKEGEGFIRINMACPWSRLEEGIKRIG